MSDRGDVATDRAAQIGALRAAMEGARGAPAAAGPSGPAAPSGPSIPSPPDARAPFAGLGAEARAAAQAAYTYLVRSTAQHPRTESEARDRLARREVTAGVIEETVAHARAQGVLDDAAFARAWVEDRGHGRGWGAARLRRELLRRGIAEPLVEDALALLAERDDFTVASQLARRRFRQLPASLEPEAAARRLHSYLVRRGHPPGLAQRVAFQVSGLDRAWD